MRVFINAIQRLPETKLMLPTTRQTKTNLSLRIFS